MLSSVLIVLFLFGCCQTDLTENRREYGSRMFSLYVMYQKEISLILLGFKQAIVDAMKRIDDLAISKYELNSFDEITFVLSIVFFSP